MATAVTVHDVARLSGLSIATVSRALSGHSVAPETAARVRAAATELGYVANEGARSLRNERTMSVGLLFRRLSQPIGLQLIDALGQVLAEDGFTLFVASARDDEDTYDLLMRRFLERRVDALICVHASGPATSLRAYKKSGVPVMTAIGRTPLFQELPHIQPDFTEPAHKMVTALMRLGHRKGVVLRGTQQRLPDDLVAQLMQSGMEVRDADYPRTAEGLAELLRTWTQPGGPTTIMATQNVASAVLIQMAQLGLTVPRDFSVVAFAQGSPDAADWQSLATVYTDGRKIGTATGAMALKLLAGGQLTGVNRVVDAELVVGDSLGLAPSR